MYFEFENYVSFIKIQNECFGGKTVKIIPQKGSQQKAINYCTDKSKKLVTPETFEYGEPKRNYFIFNRQISKSSAKASKSFKEEVNEVLEKIQKGEYTSLQDIEKKYPVLRFTHTSLLQNILNSHKRRDIDRQPAQVIWVFGEAGTGKTVWTYKYLRELGYQGFEISEIAPPSMVYDKLI